jgi:hypothetical protein
MVQRSSPWRHESKASDYDNWQYASYSSKAIYIPFSCFVAMLQELALPLINYTALKIDFFSERGSIYKLWFKKEKH